MYGQPQAQQQFKAAPDPNQAFYFQVFHALDQAKSGVLQGGQVFGFFMTSGVHKTVLAEIWDEAKQKQPGGLTAQTFMVALKLISLAQSGTAPKLANLQGKSVGPPKMSYPAGLQPPQPGGTGATGSGPEKSDPFNWLSNSAPAQKQATPGRPNWERRYSEERKPEAQAAQPQSRSTGNLRSAGHQSNQSMGLGPMLGNMGFSASQSNSVPNSYGQETSPAPQASQSPQLAALSVNPQAVPTFPRPTSGTPQGHTPVGALQNQYGPPPGHMKKMSTRDVLDDPSSLLTRRASRKLYEQERWQEQLRAAEARENRAKQQANEARISNEKLTRENEILSKEIHEARAGQAAALKQSQEALAAIQPLRLENDQLKQAIEQWKDLITSKDEELEELANEVDALRAQTERLENQMRDKATENEETGYKLQKTEAELSESAEKVRRLEADAQAFEREKIDFEQEKVSLELKIAKLEDELKKMERKQKMQTEAKQKELDVFSFGASSFQSTGSVGPTEEQKRKRTLSPRRQVPREEPAKEEKKEEPAFDAFGTSSMSPPETKQEPAPKAAMDIDIFGDLPKEPEVLSQPPPIEDSGSEEAPELEFEEREVEYESEVEELFDEQYKDSMWYLSLEKKSSYRKFFEQADTTKSGTVKGAEANRFFSKSKLDRTKLAKIWSLVDTGKKGELQEDQFYAMFHIVFLVVRSKGKVQVPTTIPECLTPQVLAKVGTSQKRIVKKTRIEKIPKPRPAPSKPKPKPKPAPAKQNNMPDFDAQPGAAPQKPPPQADDWDSFGGFNNSAQTSSFDSQPPAQAETTQASGEDGWDDFGTFDF